MPPTVTASDDLLSLLRHDWAPSSTTEMRDRDIDWTAVVRTALHHGLAGLLCRSIGALPRGIVPEEVAAAATVYLDRVNTEGSALLGQLMAVLDVLAANNIATLFFKGPTLGVLAHVSATIRPSRDIDVLVHKRDMDRAIAALSRLGYRRSVSLPPKAMTASYECYGQDIMFADGRVPVGPLGLYYTAGLGNEISRPLKRSQAKPETSNCSTPASTRKPISPPTPNSINWRRSLMP